MPGKTTAIAVIASMLPRVLMAAADAAGQVGTLASPNPIDWMNWVEKAGTIGVCIWMLVWFQKRSDTDKQELMKLATQSISAVAEFKDAMNDLKGSIDKLGERLSK